MMFDPVQLLRSFLVLTCLCGFSFLGAHGVKAWAGQNQQLGLTDSEFKQLIDTANKKAKELGYKVEELEFKLSKEGKLFVADYYPKQYYEKGVTYGGGLTIWLDMKGTIIRFERQI